MKGPLHSVPLLQVSSPSAPCSRHIFKNSHVSTFGFNSKVNCPRDIEVFIDNLGDNCHGGGSPAGWKGVVVEMPNPKAKRADPAFLTDARLRDAAILRGPGREAAWREIVHRHGPRIAQAIRRTLTRLGTWAPDDVVEDLVESTWLRTAKQDHRVLRAWTPSRGKGLGTFLAQIGIWEARTSHRLWARKKEVKLDEAELRRIADRPDESQSPNESQRLKDAETKVRAWEASLGHSERSVLEMRKEGASSRTIGLFLGRDHKTVIAILSRLQTGLLHLLEGQEQRDSNL